MNLLHIFHFNSFMKAEKSSLITIRNTCLSLGRSDLDNPSVNHTEVVLRLEYWSCLRRQVFDKSLIIQKYTCIIIIYIDVYRV